MAASGRELNTFSRDWVASFNKPTASNAAFCVEWLSIASSSPDLPADEIVRLDTRGAFINGGDASITHILGGARLFNESHATVNLHTDRRNLVAGFGAPSFDDGEQQVATRLRGGALLLIRVVAGEIQLMSGVYRVSAACFGRGLHRQEHPFDVRVMNNRRRALSLCNRRLALNPSTRVFGCLLVGTFTDCISFQSNGESRGVHHDEHVFEAAIGLTYQVADGAVFLAVGEHAGGARVNSEFVLD